IVFMLCAALFILLRCLWSDLELTAVIIRFPFFFSFHSITHVPFLGAPSLRRIPFCFLYAARPCSSSGIKRFSFPHPASRKALRKTKKFQRSLPIWQTAPVCENNYKGNHCRNNSMKN
ncbi:MAG: hypothetical protein J6F33_09525, partial [Acidaminococcaceae bacterium]|nr:hypothetical protein [Acidaminococcaceae bacterium]